MGKSVLNRIIVNIVAVEVALSTLFYLWASFLKMPRMPFLVGGFLLVNAILALEVILFLKASVISPLEDKVARFEAMAGDGSMNGGGDRSEIERLSSAFDRLDRQLRTQKDIILNFDRLLHRKSLEISVLNEVGSIGTPLRSHKSIIKTLGEILNRFLKYEAMGVAVYDCRGDGGGELIFYINNIVSRGFLAAVRERIASELPQGVKRLNVEIYSDQEGLIDDNSIDHVASYYSLPMRVGGQTVGLLAVASAASKPWSQEELEILQSVVDQASIGINASQVYGELQERVEAGEHKLTNISEVSKLIGSIMNLDRLLSFALEMTLNAVEAEVGSIVLTEDGGYSTRLAWGLSDEVVRSIKHKSGEGIVEYVMRRQEPVVIPDLGRDENFAFEEENVFIRSFMCLPLKSGSTIVGTLNIVNAYLEEFTAYDMSALTTMADLISIAIENAKLYQESLAKERLEGELELARNIQLSILPQSMPFSRRLSFGVSSIPARIIGGDYYDFIDVAEDYLGIVIADISGKGISAALFMMMVRSVLRVNTINVISANVALVSINETLASDITSDKFVTMFYCLVNESKGEMLVSGAGHSPAILYRAESGEIEFLHSSGAPIGLEEGMLYSEEVVPLNKGDIVTLYTDGITEAKNAKGEFFGIERLERLIRENHYLSARDLKDKILAEVREFVGDAPQHDDMTILIFKMER
ncbi:MAG: SpoIIE family protein phosphatase [bacterium]